MTALFGRSFEVSDRRKCHRRAARVSPVKSLSHNTHGPAEALPPTAMGFGKMDKVELKEEVAKRKLGNITVRKADPINTNLPDNCCDSIFMRRVYHHFTDPAATDAAILRALKPGGLLAVID